jgi:hypothetical protein
MLIVKDVLFLNLQRIPMHLLVYVLLLLLIHSISDMSDVKYYQTPHQ